MTDDTSLRWTRPEYSKSAVNRAARTYLSPDADPVDREQALLIMNNWRSSHRFPLNTLQVNLRNRAKRIDPDVLIAQRIKRLPSIRQKLELRPKMEFARMQDLGGCRAVVASVDHVTRLVHATLSSRQQHDLVRHDDYIAEPQPSGYRGHHLVYRYRGKDTVVWDGLSIELQIRSRLQHAWATAVETVGMFTRQSLKSSIGDPDWLRFFALMSSEIALREGSPLVPGTPEDTQKLHQEVADLADGLDVLVRLSAFNAALKRIEERSTGGEHRYYLLELIFREDGGASLRIQGANRLTEAQDLYAAAERVSEEERDRDVVLVAVDSADALRRAYPNYYADTSAFRVMVQETVTQAWFPDLPEEDS